LGISALLLMFVGFFGIDEGGSEGPSRPVSDIAAEITDTQMRIVVGNTVGMIGGLILVAFVAALRMRLAREGAPGEFFALIAYAFGLVMTIGALVLGSFRIATSAAIDPNLLVDAILPLSILKEHVADLLLLGALGLVATMSASSVLLGLLPKRFAWVGVALVAAAVALIPTGLGIGGLALFIWLIAACGVLLSTDESASTQTTSV
jgi:hypothetical protein